MKKTIEFKIEYEHNNGKIGLYYNGKLINSVYEVDMKYDVRKGYLELKGKRFLTDRKGQFYVDKNTKDTAFEDINLLNLFNDNFINIEIIKEEQKMLENTLFNIYLTSFVNAEKLINKRDCFVKVG